MSRQTNKAKAKQLAQWIWDDCHVQLFTCDYGKRYGFAIANENGSAEKSLTPYMPIKELLSYLHGILAAKNNPDKYQPSKKSETSVLNPL